MLSAPDSARPSGRIIFPGVLLLGMTAATLMPGGLGILAPFMRDDLGLSRTRIGFLISTVLFLGAVVAPRAGRATDALGGRRGIVLLFATAILGLVGVAVAPSYWWMLLPVAVAALPQAAGNPVTNKLIATHSPPGRRGLVTGIKQSGVQAGNFVAGLAMPAIALAWGWRWAIGFAAVVPLLGLVGTFGWVPHDRPAVASSATVDSDADEPLPVAITFLAVYGGLMGFGAAYQFLIPLFAEEALGMTEQAGGAAIGVIGFVALFARIGWARFADVNARHDLTLAILAVGSVFAVMVLLVAQAGASWLLWVGAALTGVTASSWNSVGMLAVIEHAGEKQSGRASGIVMLGFLGGVGIGPTVFGWLVDRTDSYTPMWLTSLMVLGSAAVLSVWWTRRSQHPSQR